MSKTPPIVGKQIAFDATLENLGGGHGLLRRRGAGKDYEGIWNHSAVLVTATANDSEQFKVSLFPSATASITSASWPTFEKKRAPKAAIPSACGARPSKP